MLPEGVCEIQSDNNEHVVDPIVTHIENATTSNMPCDGIVTEQWTR